MESWRRQVIAVQADSIREAEAKARDVMEQVTITVICNKCYKSALLAGIPCTYINTVKYVGYSRL